MTGSSATSFKIAHLLIEVATGLAWLLASPRTLGVAPEARAVRADFSGRAIPESRSALPQPAVARIIAVFKMVLGRLLNRLQAKQSLLSAGDRHKKIEEQKAAAKEKERLEHAAMGKMEFEARALCLHP